MVVLPVVDVSALVDADADPDSCARVGRTIDAACRDTGFLLVTGHGIDPALRDELEQLSRTCFALSDTTKAEIARRLPVQRAPGPHSHRWDGQSVHDWDGVYGDYLTAKVAKVFPELAAAIS